MRKLILVLIDGMGDHVSHKMGYLKALESANMGKKFTLLSELPSLSRPLYETILTGKTPIKSSIIYIFFQIFNFNILFYIERSVI